MSWLGRIFRRRHLYNELGEEVRAHLEEKTEQLMRLENLPRAEARQAALRAFGNLALIEERATSSTFRPASTCFCAAIICASVCLLFDMLRPHS
jgi:hypothetical protein